MLITSEDTLPLGESHSPLNLTGGGKKFKYIWTVVLVCMLQHANPQLTNQNRETESPVLAASRACFVHLFCSFPTGGGNTFQSPGWRCGIDLSPVGPCAKRDRMEARSCRACFHSVLADTGIKTDRPDYPSRVDFTQGCS